MDDQQYLFLDFDGPLHPAQAYVQVDDVHLPLTKLQAAGLFFHLNVLEEFLSDHRNLGIVVHSSLRLTHSYAELQGLLGPLGQRVVGVTQRELDRELSILEFVRRRRIAAEQYRVLDDQPELFPRLAGTCNFISCDPVEGIAASVPMAQLAHWLRIPK